MLKEIDNETREIFELITTTHMICILILCLVFVINDNFFHTTDYFIIYPIINIRVFLILCLVGFGIFLLSNTVTYLRKKESKYLPWVNLVYVTIPLFIALASSLFVDDGYNLAFILILPVLIAASVFGKRAGLIMSAICSLILVIFKAGTGAEKSVLRALESNLVMISVIFVVGWFIGNLTNIEVKQREKLKNSLLSLEEEMAKRQLMDKEIARLDRLNLVGEMAASIGHEVRNPMTTVRGFLQLLGEKKDCLHYKEHYDLMIEELDRANSIITEFLSLAKNRLVQFKKNNLNSVILALEPLILADAYKTSHKVSTDLQKIPDLLLDEREIRQLVLNLVRNGLEAMPSGGTLLVKTFTEGEEVVLVVQDQGKGIEPEILEKIGTPFLTTKENGTGLGLAVCYSIATKHNAVIDVDTGPAGTTFCVRFNAGPCPGCSPVPEANQPGQTS